MRRKRRTAWIVGSMGSGCSPRAISCSKLACFSAESQEAILLLPVVPLEMGGEEDNEAQDRGFFTPMQFYMSSICFDA
jgi:hypothetical protein